MPSWLVSGTGSEGVVQVLLEIAQASVLNH